jgi:hypothetical protein
MGHIPDDEHFDEFMNASAEEWSKPEEVTPQKETIKEQTDRWGSPVPQKGSTSDANRWGSEPLESSKPDGGSQKKKGASKWWVIAIIIVVVLCLCLCLALVVLSITGVIAPLRDFSIFSLLSNRFIL